MFGIGMQELLLIGLIVVVVFGGSRLPELGEGMGKMIGNFRKSIKGDDKQGEKKDAPPEKIPGA